ncbi:MULTISPECIES: mevalonate kinase [Listeria]|uniref:mevalonate kinase n=1 Tax=Listeria TaxID=1637 RepID=UPI000B58CB57|nr:MULTISPECIES: mevalonate kinase [Listeria]
MATGSATAKLILCGEHAVVYGEPAISIPFAQAVIQTEVIKTEKETKFSSAFYTGDLKNMPDFLEGIKQMVVAILDKLGQAPVLIRVLSEVPIGRGLGSSAAVSTSIARALYAYFEQTISDSELLELVNQSEKIAHGNPSGVDAVTVVTGKPIWFEKNKTLEPLHFEKKIYLVVADTGIPSETRSAVSDVGRLLQENPKKYRPFIAELGNISREIRGQLENNPDLKIIGAEMNKAQNLLEQLTVSDSSLEKLIRVALQNGALGAKLTGGGRGGCMISLVAGAKQAEKVAQALKNAGAAQEWIFTIGEGNHESNSDSSHEYSAH